MLVRLTPVVNFINVMCARFLYKFFNKAKMYLEKRRLYEKYVRKMFVKLTPWFDFTKVL